MRTFSIAGTAILFLIALSNLIRVFQVYYQLVSPLISEELGDVITKPTKIYASIFFVFFLISLVLTVRKKYQSNIIISGIVIFAHLIIINFIGIEWLK
jgi:hypothetical protein